MVDIMTVVVAFWLVRWLATRESSGQRLVRAGARAGLGVVWIGWTFEPVLPNGFQARAKEKLP